MTESKNKNPFLKDNMSQGGGAGWSGRVVLVTAASVERRKWTRGDGSAVLSSKTNEQIVSTSLIVKGIAEGTDREFTREYEAPFLMPTEDGDGFADPKRQDGSFTLKASSPAGKFISAFQDGGGDLGTISTVEKDGRVTTHVSGLTGAKILFKAEAVLDKDGKPKVDKKGYPELLFFPDEVLAQGQGRQGGNATSPEVASEAAALVTEIVNAAPDRRISKNKLVQEASKLARGRKNSGDILQHIIKDDNIKAMPGLSYSGTEVSVSA